MNDATTRTPTVLELSGETTPIRQLLADFWDRRGLVPMLAAKDFNARYRSASLGVLWSVLMPLVQGVVLAVVFTKVIPIKLSAGNDYHTFVISGTVFWGFFSSSTIAGSTVIVDQSAIASKVYFPRLILPLVPATASLISFGLSVLVLIPIMLTSGTKIQWTIFALPLAMLGLYLLVVTLSAIIGLLHVYFRDIRYIVQATLLVLLYATPVIYPFEKAIHYKWLLLANPATGPLNLARWALFGNGVYVLPAVLTSLAWCVVLFIISLHAYSRHERVATDRL